MSSTGYSLAIAILALVVVGAGQQRQWWDLYDEAIKHIQQQEWQEAETKLLQARKEGPPSGRSVLRYGSLRPAFFPEYYLGLVYQATGRPKEALQQFQLARKANIDVRNPEFRQIGIFEGMAKTAATTLAKGPQPAGPQPVAPSGSNVEPKPTPPRPDTAPPIVAPTTLPTPNYALQFNELLSTARNQLSQRNYDGAEQTATSARDLAIKYNLVAERPRAETLLRDISGARFAARVENALDRRDAVAARRELNVLTAAVPDYRADTLRDRVDALERELRSAELYRSAMRAFFGGGYQQSLSLLAEVEKLSALTPRGHFYRACSLAALAAATPNPSQDRRLAEAKRSYSVAAPARDQFRQDLRYISPKIRQLLGM